MTSRVMLSMFDSNILYEENIWIFSVKFLLIWVICALLVIKAHNMKSSQRSAIFRGWTCLAMVLRFTDGIVRIHCVMSIVK